MNGFDTYLQTLSKLRLLFLTLLLQTQLCGKTKTPLNRLFQTFQTILIIIKSGFSDFSPSSHLHYGQKDKLQQRVFHSYLCWNCDTSCSAEADWHGNAKHSWNLKCVFHQGVLITKHILPLRNLGVSVSKNSHCVRSWVGLLQGV